MKFVIGERVRQVFPGKAIVKQRVGTVIARAQWRGDWMVKWDDDPSPKPRLVPMYEKYLEAELEAEIAGAAIASTPAPAHTPTPAAYVPREPRKTAYPQPAPKVKKTGDFTNVYMQTGAKEFPSHPSKHSSPWADWDNLPTSRPDQTKGQK